MELKEIDMSGLNAHSTQTLLRQMPGLEKLPTEQRIQVLQTTVQRLLAQQQEVTLPAAPATRTHQTAPLPAPDAITMSRLQELDDDPKISPNAREQARRAFLKQQAEERGHRNLQVA